MTEGYYDEDIVKQNEFESNEVALEYQCIECGNEGNYMCACCGANLCHMHQETQAGFCSRFTTELVEEGQKYEIYGIRDIERGDKIRFVASQKVSGCFIGDRICVLPSMSDEPDNLDKEKIKVIEDPEMEK